MGSVIVFHPGLQHSHQLAWALYERDLLLEFISAVPVIGSDEPRAPWWLPERLKRRARDVGIPSALKSHPAFLYAMQRAILAASSERGRTDNVHRSFHAFDYWASKQVAKRRPAAVVAYENSAYHTFRSAKAVGAKCILDLPSIERHSADLLIPTRATQYGEEIAMRKDAEIAMADLILTCSHYAASTYIDAGIPAEKIRCLQLGAFIPALLPPRVRSDSEVLQLVFAGAFGYRKSADLILDALERLGIEGYSVHLNIVGVIEEAQSRERIRKAGNIDYLGQKSQSELFGIIRNSDCLLLPSRFDSFGMVVAESLACGTPVIVSNTTGAKEIVEANAGVGWIVDATAESIYKCIVARCSDRNELQNARSTAGAAAKRFTWEDYRYRAGEMLEAWLNEQLVNSRSQGSQISSTPLREEKCD